MIIAMVLAGGLGAVLRFLVDHLSARLITRHFPLGTLIVNVTGSLALGLVVGALGAHSDATLVLGTGLLGGFTTFSTHAVETLRLWMVDGRWRAALVNATLTLTLCLIAGWLGLTLFALVNP